MRMKTLVILAVVTVPTVAVALLLPPSGGTTLYADQEHPSGRLLPDVKSHLDTLAQIDIAAPGGMQTLARTVVPGKPYDGWTLRTKGGYPVDTAKVRPVIDSLATLHGVAPKTTNPKLYGRLDVGDPGTGAAKLVALTDSAGKSLGTIILGKITGQGGMSPTDRIYVRVPKSAQTWLAAPVVPLWNDQLDWLDRVILDIDADQLQEVLLTQPGNPPLDLVRAKPGDKLGLRNIPAGQKAKSDTPGSDLEEAFGGLSFDDVKRADQLTGSQAGTVHLVTFDGTTVDMALRKDNGQTWATVSAAGGKPADEINARTKGWAYEIPSDKAATLTTALASLIEPVKK
jgi:hypothetical protein